MKYIIDHDYHIHSHLSSCSADPEQTAERILAYARENHLHEIVLTDHFWDSARIPCPVPWYDGQDLAHIEKSLPLPQAEDVRFLFGCETEMANGCLLGIAPETLDKFDFIIVPTTHLHLSFYPYEATSQDRADAWVSRFQSLLERDLPFHKMGLAHPTCHLIDYRYPDGALRALRLIPDAVLERLFALAARKGLGIELNENPLRYTESEREDLFRPYRIAKACGCKFYLGSDAHHPKEFDEARTNHTWMINALDLSENDKFHLPGKENRTI